MNEGGYKSIEVDYAICTYCGSVATTVDHVPPRALRGLNVEHLLLPCCLECNVLLGSFIGLNVKDRKRFLLKKYKNRYARLLKTPDWTAEELLQVGENLRSSITQALLSKREVNAKLQSLR